MLDIQDRYIFTSNRLLNDLNYLAKKHEVSIEIINVEYDDEFAIPKFILVTAAGTKQSNFNEELEVIFDKCQAGFINASLKSRFSNPHDPLI